MYHWVPEMKTYTFRLLAAFLTLVFRLVIGWYSGVDFMSANPHTANYMLWSAIISILVYFSILPRRRTADRHPHQRSTDTRGSQ